MPNPYEITSDADGYVFTTDSGITYKIVFLELDFSNDYPTLAGRMFSYSFLPTDKTIKRRLDNRVKDTIAHSITQFFQNRENLIVFVCDSTDNMHLGRERLFDRWFSEFNDGSLEKYNGKAISNDVYISNTIIMKSDLSDKTHIIKIFDDLNTEFAAAK